MKFRKEITILSVLIIALSLIAALTGIFSGGGPGRYAFTSLRGESVEIYGKGVYQWDSVSLASQAIAQDAVTLLVGIPLLVMSLILDQKKRLKGKLLLAGTLAYFLYTYTSYSFLSMYNPLFLAYVTLMSLSFFAFLLTMMSFDITALEPSLNSKFPAGPISGFLLFVGIAIGLMWLGKIVPSLSIGAAPAGLEHYTTFVIQAMDLGFLVPSAVVSSILLLKRKPFGLLVSSVICIKGLTMLTAITAMVIGQILAGVDIKTAEAIMFPAFNLAAIVILVLLLQNIKDPGATSS